MATHETSGKLLSTPTPPKTTRSQNEELVPFPLYIAPGPFGFAALAYLDAGWRNLRFNRSFS
jgi:hypothetical protein